MTPLDLARGSRVLYKLNSNSGWKQGLLEAVNGELGQVSTDSGAVVDCPIQSVQPANPVEYDDSEDLCQLPELSETTVLYNLHTRFEGDAIYTFAGPVLIALNPCKQLPLYTPEVAAKYTGSDLIDTIPL
jgi:myosin V